VNNRNNLERVGLSANCPVPAACPKWSHMG